MKYPDISTALSYCNNNPGLFIVLFYDMPYMQHKVAFTYN